MKSHHHPKDGCHLKQRVASNRLPPVALPDNFSRNFDLVRNYLFSGNESDFDVELILSDRDKAMIHCEVLHWVREACESVGCVFTARDAFVDCYDLGNRLARNLQVLLDIDACSIIRPDVGMRVSVEAEVFIDLVVQAINDGLNSCRLFLGASKCDVNNWVDSRNRLVDKIRQAMSERETKRRRKNQLRAVRENLKSILSGMVAAFEKHSKILALRFDVGFHKPVEHPRLQPQIDFDAVHVAREKLLKHIERRFGGALVWYVWKIEYGQEKGFHIHWLVFLNGSLHSRDGHLVKEIGEFWSKQVVPGSGLYFNCSVLKQQYRSCGIGPLDASDPEIWTGLGLIAQYFTKLEQLVGGRISGGRRSMGTSQIKSSEGHKPGPKRKTGLQLPPDIRRLVFGS